MDVSEKYNLLSLGGVPEYLGCLPVFFSKVEKDKYSSFLLSAWRNEADAAVISGKESLQKVYDIVSVNPFMDIIISSIGNAEFEKIKDDLKDTDGSVLHLMKCSNRRCVQNILESSLGKNKLIKSLRLMQRLTTISLALTDKRKSVKEQLKECVEFYRAKEAFIYIQRGRTSLLINSSMLKKEDKRQLKKEARNIIYRYDEEGLILDSRRAQSIYVKKSGSLKYAACFSFEDEGSAKKFCEAAASLIKLILNEAKTALYKKLKDKQLDRVKAKLLAEHIEKGKSYRNSSSDSNVSERHAKSIYSQCANIKEKHEELKKKYSMIRRIFATARVGTMHLDSYFYMMSMNSVALRIFKYSKDEMREKKFADMAIDFRQFMQMKKSLESSGKYESESWFKTKNDKEVWARYSIRRFSPKCQSKAKYFVVIYNLTDQKNVIEELLGVIRKLNETRALLSKANEEKNVAVQFKEKYISELAHDLRTPLNAIINHSKNISENKYSEDETKKERAPDILRLSRKMLGMINDVLTMNKIGNNKLTLFFEKINLSETIRQELDTVFLPFFQTDGNKELVLIYDIDKEIFADADESRILQIIDNLVANALKYTEKGHVKVSLKRKGEGYIELSVADTGKGIDGDELDDIFGSYSQGAEKPFVNETGVGLGLSIVKVLAQMHGGDIEVDSVLGVGSCFSVKIPEKRTAKERRKEGE